MKLLKILGLAFFFLHYYIGLLLLVLRNLFRKGTTYFLGEGSQKIQISPFGQVHPYVFAPVQEVITRDGYVMQAYHIQTEDHASLTMWRLHRQKSDLSKPYPVLLMHGLLDCSVSWFMNEDKMKTLPYILAAQGYDVWLGNNRGNRISDQNSNKKEDSYALDHLIEFDQPTLINKVLNQTGKQKIIYIGHSQGTTQFLLGLGVNPHLKECIAKFIGLGTVVSLKHVEDHPVLNVLGKFSLLQLANFFGFKRLLVVPRALTKAVGVLIDNSKLYFALVMSTVRMLCGYSENNNISGSLFGSIISQQPGGASTNNTLQWVQCYRHGQMRYFDHGKKENMQKYGSQQPPQYCLKHLSTLQFESYLFRGMKDRLISDKSFENLKKCFNSEKIGVYQVQDYHHLDYLWSHKAHSDLYSDILQIVKYDQISLQ